MLTQSEIDRLRGICDAATPGPWKGRLYDGRPVLGAKDFFDDERLEANQLFISEARIALPAALEAIKEMRKILAILAQKVDEAVQDGDDDDAHILFPAIALLPKIKECLK